MDGKIRILDFINSTEPLNFSSKMHLLRNFNTFVKEGLENVNKKYALMFNL